jgi:anti-sigma regulatory factor (Ser/Thr protein kinase)
MGDHGSLLRLTLASDPENVAVVRHALAGLAEAIGMDDGGIADLKTVVTEACMNVVVHAYGSETGPMEISASPDGDALLIVVRDEGEGIRPRPAMDSEPSLRLGLPLIAALSTRFEIRGGHHGGTEVRMRMALSHADDEEQAPFGSSSSAAGTGTVISVAAGDLVAPIVSRVISVLAARADLSVDRLSDAVLLADSISANSGDDFPEGRLVLEVEDAGGAVEIRIGPVSTGAGDRILDAMDLPTGGSLRALADEARVESGGDGGERVLLRIAQR